MHIKLSACLIFILCTSLGVMFTTCIYSQSAQKANTVSFQNRFDNLPALPKTLNLKGRLLFPLEGGHIQGIQLGIYEGKVQAMLSGSSRDVAYIMVGEVNEDHIEIHAVDTLMADPFRHAGGFQWYSQFVALGIEDNFLRERSKVMVFDLYAEEPWKNPLIILNREGEKERVTAGAVGMTAWNGEIILAVANWDAKNIDFYSCDSAGFYRKEPSFSVLGSYSSDEKDQQWLAYQNINLFAENDTLFLVGFGRDVQDRHVADLYMVHLGEKTNTVLPFDTDQMLRSGETIPVPNSDEVELRLEILGQYPFQTKRGADFKAGAGFFYHDGKLGLIAAPYQLDGGEGVNVFREFEEWDSDNRVSLPFSTQWELVGSFSAPEARQAALATKDHYFAIDNTRVGKYDRDTGDLIQQNTYKDTKHLNSGYLYEDMLLLAHSNYPAAIDSSDIRVLDPETMKMNIFKDFGRSEGSLTWVLEKEGYWYCLFAYYREENNKTYLAKFDANWEEVERWMFPQEVLDKIGHMSISGGVFWESGLLVTSHDDRELHYIKIPDTGHTLQYITTFPAPFWGQGIAVDPITNNLIGIDRPTRQLLMGGLRP